MPGRNCNLRTRHLLVGSARLFLAVTLLLSAGSCRLCTRTRTAKRSSLIVRFVILPTWSFNGAVRQSSATHCRCRGQGVDCAVAYTCHSFLQLPLHSASAWRSRQRLAVLS